MSNNRKFIPFHTSENQAETDTTPEVDSLVSYKKTLLDLAIEVSLGSANLLEFSKEKQFDKAEITVDLLRQKLESISKELADLKPKPTNYMCFTGVTDFNTILTKLADKAGTAEFNVTLDKHIEKSLEEKQSELLDKARQDIMNRLAYRHLDNGGLAPIKDWKSISDIKLKSSDKYSLIEEMRKMQAQGATIAKSTFHYKTPINISEFTEPFKYLENMHDYSGPFLITLLKSDAEILNQAHTLQVDLTAEKNSCANGENIILSIYDISGSVSGGEEKKFLIVLLFDKLNGVLRYSHPIFMNGKGHKLSSRQINEIEKFCKTKKITLY